MKPVDTRWLIVTPKSPIVVHQTYDESWLLNPNRRYILSANQVETIEPYLENVSEFAGSSLHNPINAGCDLNGAKILVERCRERGLGDLLFMTGPLSYIQHITGGTAQIDLMAWSDRGSILNNLPALNNKGVKCGPVEYDALRHYNYHWFVSNVTENDGEQDQLNVYDALYRQLGLAPDQIESRWKRPYAVTTENDFRALDMLYRRIWEDRKLELRRIGYVVVAPFSTASLRCMNYTKWLEIIAGLSTRRPVVVVGSSQFRLPDTDISAGDFIANLSSMGQAVINAIDSTNTRSLMALIARASAVVTLDSAPLYIAQAVSTPAVSLWGTHAPGTRIGYAPEYMQYAIWNEGSCRRAPCFAYNRFPHEKCPDGANQRTCELLKSIEATQVFERVDHILDQAVASNYASK